MKKSFLKEVITDNSEREVDDSFSNFLCGFNKMKSMKESLDDEALSNEITLFIEGDWADHVQPLLPFKTTGVRIQTSQNVSESVR